MNCRKVFMSTVLHRSCSQGLSRSCSLIWQALGVSLLFTYKACRRPWGFKKCSKQWPCLTDYWWSSKDFLPLPSSSIQSSAEKLQNGKNVLCGQISLPQSSMGEGLRTWLVGMNMMVMLASWLDLVMLKVFYDFIDSKSKVSEEWIIFLCFSHAFSHGNELISICTPIIFIWKIKSALCGSRFTSYKLGIREVVFISWVGCFLFFFHWLVKF